MTEVGAGKADEAAHVPVLYQAVLEGLRVRPGGTYIDASVGGGGHAAGILARASPGGRLIGLDRDPSALSIASRKLGPCAGRVVLVQGSFAMLGDIARTAAYAPADGVLFDLGLSSYQLGDPSRGFTFMADGPLDMRFDTTADTPTAADLVNDMPYDELTTLIRRYGEEQNARRIAKAIVAARPIHTTRMLAQVIVNVVGEGHKPIHPATQTFQALRIAVNGELDALADALPQAIGLLAPGGRLAVISFHSLEDRLVKLFMRKESKDCICPPEAPVCRCGHRATLSLVTRRPVRPSPEEVQSNRRARSARLRIAQRTLAPVAAETKYK